MRYPSECEILMCGDTLMFVSVEGRTIGVETIPEGIIGSEDILKYIKENLIEDEQTDRGHTEEVR